MAEILRKDKEVINFVSKYDKIAVNGEEGKGNLIYINICFLRDDYWITAKRQINLQISSLSWGRTLTTLKRTLQIYRRPARGEVSNAETNKSGMCEMEKAVNEADHLIKNYTPSGSDVRIVEIYPHNRRYLSSRNIYTFYSSSVKIRLSKSQPFNVHIEWSFSTRDDFLGTGWSDDEMSEEEEDEEGQPSSQHSLTPDCNHPFRLPPRDDTFDTDQDVSAPPEELKSRQVEESQKIIDGASQQVQGWLEFLQAGEHWEWMSVSKDLSKYIWSTESARDGGRDRKFDRRMVTFLDPFTNPHCGLCDQDHREGNYLIPESPIPRVVLGPPLIRGESVHEADIPVESF